MRVPLWPYYGTLIAHEVSAMRVPSWWSYGTLMAHEVSALSLAMRGIPLMAMSLP